MYNGLVIEQQLVLFHYTDRQHRTTIFFILQNSNKNTIVLTHCLQQFHEFICQQNYSNFLSAENDQFPFSKKCSVCLLPSSSTVNSIAIWALGMKKPF